MSLVQFQSMPQKQNTERRLYNASFLFLGSVYPCVFGFNNNVLNSMARVLVVDDEQDLCEILRFNLESEGFEVLTCEGAEEALTLMSENTHREPDLILLDVMMGEMSGFEMAKKLREQNINTPIIFLTARDDHDDQLTGFACGADDYITKPFSFDTVLARVKAVLKRTKSQSESPQPSKSDNTTLCCSGLIIDTNHQTVTVQGAPVELTRREYLILCLMAKSPNQYFSREKIMAAVWPNNALVNDRSVDVHIARLRKKLGSYGRFIVNRTGFGYALNSNNL